MVDATQMGTVCMTLRHKRDLDTLFGALGGESGLELTKDVILGSGDSLEMIDEKKSLALIGKELVKSADDAREKFREQHGLIREDGKFQTSVKIAFFNMGAVEQSVGHIADDLKKKDVEKAKREERKLEAEEAEQDARDIGGKLSYSLPGQSWEVPEHVAEDARKKDPTLAAGGDPQRLEVKAKKTIERDKTRPDWRPITSHMVGEPNAKGDFKVYIEQEEVVTCEASQIRVEFLSTSYSVRVETEAEPLVLGPIDCGQVDVRASSWRLSKGKRLTISVVKARTDASLSSRGKGAAGIQSPSADKPAQEQQEQQGWLGSVIFGLVTLLPVAVAFYFFNGKTG